VVVFSTLLQSEFRDSVKWLIVDVTGGMGGTSWTVHDKWIVPWRTGSPLESPHDFDLVQSRTAILRLDISDEGAMYF
jgi:hypothetical protein